MRRATTGIVLLPLAMAALASSASAQGVRMLPATRVETQSVGGHRLAACDVDLDGVLDLVSLNGKGQLDPQAGYRVFRGLGDGTFETGVSYFGPYNDEFAFGDFTGDGYPDLVTGDFNEQPSKSVWLFPSQGDGTFGAPIESPLPLSAHTRSLTGGDFDGDGQLDLAVHGLGFVWWLFVAHGHGDGSFGPYFSLGQAGGGALVAVDIDADGNLDLIEGERLRVRLGNGDGTFQPPIENTPPIGFQPALVHAVDLDGDGLLDTISASNGLLYLHQGHGDGTLTQVYIDQSAVYQFGEAVADLDGDGLLDLIFSRLKGFDFEPPAGLTVRRGLGGFAFGPPAYFPTGGAPSDVAPGDFDGDGRIDVALAQHMQEPSSFGLSDLALAFGQGDGTFAAPLAVAVSGGPLATELADMNGDGHLDVVSTVTTVLPAVRVALGVGDGSFEPAVGVDVGDNEGELAIADLDGDGALDLVVAGDPPFGATVAALGAGDGIHFGAPVQVATSDVADVRIGDLDDDGAPDIAVTRTAPGVVTLYFGDGRGGFGAGVYLSAGGFPTGMELADLDGDGQLDIAVADTSTGQLGLLINLGGRAFALPQRLAAPGQPQHVVAGDLDRDGVVDLATADQQPKRASVFLGTGGGTFAAPVSYELGRLSRALAAIDVNRDGVLDLVNVHGSDEDPEVINEDEEPGSISILLGRGDGSFLQRRLFFTGANPLDLGVGDADEDGFPDVATACRNDQKVWVSSNLSGPWENLGFALAAPAGTPKLTGSGVPKDEEHVALLATDVPAGSPGLLFIGLSTVTKPLQGGTLVPFPSLTLPIQPNVLLRGRWSPAIPPGTPVYFQAWFTTPPGGEVAATNALLTIGE